MGQSVLLEGDKGVLTEMPQECVRVCVMMVVSGFFCQYFHFGEPDLDLAVEQLKQETNRLPFLVWDVRFG